MGPVKQIKRMLDPNRLVATCLVLVSNCISYLKLISWHAFISVTNLKMFLTFQLFIGLTLCAALWVSRIFVLM